MSTKIEADWMSEQFAGLTESLQMRKPSELAEEIRYLPPSTTNVPGPFRFDMVPYWREVVDCFAEYSPVRHVSIMKGVQVAFTVAVLENVILTYIVDRRTAPVLFVTADNELSDLRVQTNIVPMIQDSGISDLISSGDKLSAKKQGKTSHKIEWIGGGFLMPIGAKNPVKMSSLPFPCVIRDEIDRWPLTTKDGDPMKLTHARTKTFGDVYKLLDGSTPVDKDTSQIYKEFLLGDQRRWFVKCQGCGEEQTIRWRREDSETGVVSGMVWEMRGGQVVRDSVRYECKFCGHAHYEKDKPRLIHSGQWKPTATPADDTRRSYHVPQMISLLSNWYDCVVDYVEAMGDDPTQPKDIEKLKVFYNNILGEPFTEMGRSVSISHVKDHRRIEYAMGFVPQRYARRVTGHPISLLTTAVDVQHDSLSVATFGWTRGLRTFVIDYRKMMGNPADPEDLGTWGTLGDYLENKEFTTDEQTQMRPAFVVVDSGDGAMTSNVYTFCAQYAPGPIFPIKGRDAPTKGATMPFVRFQTALNSVGFHVVVDHYKDRWSMALRKMWIDGDRMQPEGHFNVPVDLDDEALKELTRERKIPNRSKTGRIAAGAKPYVWHRTGRNELWDLLMYNSAAIDIACYDICTSVLGLEVQNWPLFWNFVENNN